MDSRMLVCALVALVAWLLWHALNLDKRFHWRRFPGPKPSLLTGSLAEMRRQMVPYAYTAWAKQYGPIFRVWFVRRPVLVITDVQFAKTVMVKAFKAFHDRGRPMRRILDSKAKMAAETSGMLPARGDYWASLRAGVQPMFHNASLESYAPIINAAADGLLEALKGPAQEGQVVNMHAVLGRMTMQVIGRAGFGVAFETQKADEAEAPLVEAAKNVFTNSRASPWGIAGMLLPPVFAPLLRVGARLFPTETQRHLKKASDALWDSSRALIENARQHMGLKPGALGELPGADWSFVDGNPDNEFRLKGTTPAENSVIGMLLKARNKHNNLSFTDVQIAAQSNTFILAGYETTANALSFCIYLLTRHPEVQARMLEEIDSLQGQVPQYSDMERLPYTTAVLQESLRIFPPAAMTDREAEVDFVLGEHRIEQGTWIHINIYGMHHNEEYFTDAEVFKPQRWLGDKEGVREPDAYMPFGMGPRKCIGWRLAMEEALFALVRVYQRYTFKFGPELAGKDLPLRFALTLAPKDGLPVVPVLRN